jgi:hypothetical protein
MCSPQQVRQLALPQRGAKTCHRILDLRRMYWTATHRPGQHTGLHHKQCNKAQARIDVVQGIAQGSAGTSKASHSNFTLILGLHVSTAHAALTAQLSHQRLHLAHAIGTHSQPRSALPVNTAGPGIKGGRHQCTCRGPAGLCTCLCLHCQQHNLPALPTAQPACLPAWLTVRPTVCKHHTSCTCQPGTEALQMPPPGA